MSEDNTQQHFFDSGLQDLRALKMTEEERARILAKIQITPPTSDTPAPTQPGANHFSGTSTNGTCV